MKKSSTLKELEKRIEETKTKNIEEFKQAELRSLEEFARQSRELLTKELDTMLIGINEVREHMQEIKKEQMQTSKKHWLIPTLIGLLILAGIILLKTKQPQEMTEKEVRSWLEKNYKIVPTKNGWRLIEKKKGE